MRKELIGIKFGRLTVLEFDYEKYNLKNRLYWICKCECGKVKSIQQSHLNSGASKSCGCLQKENACKCNSKHGGRGTSLYNRWKAMKQRCLNPKSKSYKNYGARGVTICNEWIDDFSIFYDWAINNGYEEALQLDRIDNDGNYEPSNCRWVTTLKNNHNRRITVKIEDKTLIEISELYNIKFTKIKDRYYRLRKVKDNVCIEDLIA